MNVKLTDKERIRITNPDDLYGIMQRILLRENKIDREKEHFWIVGMNIAGVILYIELVSMGSVKGTMVEPMNVFRVAILKGATSIIAVHNHPSGVIEASRDDTDCTDRLIQVGRIINITVEDHLIISPEGYMSMRRSGIMGRLDGSRKYVPAYQLVDRVREEEETIRKETEKRHRHEIVQYRASAVNNLMARDISKEEIAAILGMELSAVEQQISDGQKKK